METKEEPLTTVKGYEGKPITYNITGISEEEEEGEEEPPKKEKKTKKKKKEKKNKKKEKKKKDYSYGILFYFVVVIMFITISWVGLYQLNIQTPLSPLPLVKLTLVPPGSNTTSLKAAHPHLYPRIRKLLLDHSVKFKQQPLMCLHHVGNLTAEIPKIRVCLFRKTYLMVNPLVKWVKDASVIDATENSVGCIEPKRKNRFDKVSVVWTDEFGMVLSSRFNGEEAVLFQMTEDEFSGQC